MKQLLQILLFFCVIFLFPSCKKVEEHKIRIVNKTNFHIDVFKLHDNDHEYTFEIAPFDSTEIINIDLITRCFCNMAGPYILANVDEFSDSTDNYTHTRVSVGDNRFEVDGLNIIEITLVDNPQFPNYVFNLSLRE